VLFATIHVGKPNGMMESFQHSNWGEPPGLVLKGGSFRFRFYYRIFVRESILDEIAFLSGGQIQKIVRNV
jgi:hypothetical protein